MIVLYLALAGLLTFVFGVGILGLLLRKHPSKENAEKNSRIAHFLFFCRLGYTLCDLGVLSWSYPCR